MYCLQQYKGYTLNSAYHNVVVEEGWAIHEDGAAEFLVVKLLAA